MTKPFFKRGDATIYYNYSEWPSRSCNFRKSLGKPRPFLYSPKFLGRRSSRYILSGTSGKKKSREKKRKDGERPKRKKRREMKSKRSAAPRGRVGAGGKRGGGGKINAPSGIARKASVWRAWRATTGLARWLNSLSLSLSSHREKEEGRQRGREGPV